jgi:hypothetical protein
MSPSSHSAPSHKMRDVESYGKALEKHSSCIASALGIFLGRLENERAWWYAIVPGDLNEATLSRLLGIIEYQWMVCLRVLKCITFKQKKGTDEPILTVKVEKIKALMARSDHSTPEIERSKDNNNQQRWFIQLGKFSDPKQPFTVKHQWDWARDAEKHKTRSSQAQVPASRRRPQIPEAWTTEFRAALGEFSKELAGLQAGTSPSNVEKPKTTVEDEATVQTGTGHTGLQAGTSLSNVEKPKTTVENETTVQTGTGLTGDFRDLPRIV